MDSVVTNLSSVQNCPIYSTSEKRTSTRIRSVMVFVRLSFHVFVVLSVPSVSLDLVRSWPMHLDLLSYTIEQLYLILYGYSSDRNTQWGTANGRTKVEHKSSCCIPAMIVSNIKCNLNGACAQKYKFEFGSFNNLLLSVPVANTSSANVVRV